MAGDMLGRIDWVALNCRLLRAIALEFSHSKPFDGVTIGTGIHLEPKTVALLMTLRAGGARIVATGNLSSTQPATVAHLVDQGIEVFAEHTTDPAVHDVMLGRILAEKPEILLDNGGDLFARYLDDPYDGLIGGTEETTSGRVRLMDMRDALAMPILVINDSPIKQFAENKHAVGQSMFESYMRLTNRSTNGKSVTVMGYGACGQGVARAFRNAYAQVSVVDVDPVAELAAHFDGFITPGRDAALTSADVIVTQTGVSDVIGAADLASLKDGVILMNGGHFPWEIAVDALRQATCVANTAEYLAQGIETLTLEDGRCVHVLTDGHMANLAGPGALGNSIEAMDIGFALQARCLECVVSGTVGPEACLVPVPSDIDAYVAQSYLNMRRP